MAYNRKAALAKIIIMGKQRDLDSDDLRKIARDMFHIRGDVHLSKLSNGQMSAMIEHLTNPSRPVQVQNRATARQTWKINQLADQLGLTEDGLADFLERQIGRRDMRNLRDFEAVKVIEGFKQLVNRRSKDVHTCQRSQTA